MTLADVDAHDLVVRSYRAGFAAGREVGEASAAAELARANAEADLWYFEANNPDETRERRRALASTASIDARAARQETAERLAALDAAGKQAS